ncbi:hypothetical protein LJB42_003190 [Komagataella kurtzmanii]|nr:hypothetical protein LJB42_003190 [Komagataella kurtzmanii]
MLVDKYAQLMTWLQSSNKTFISEKLWIVDDSSTGKSIYTVQSLKTNEHLVTIPREFMLNFITILLHIEKISNKTFDIPNEYRIANIASPSPEDSDYNLIYQQFKGDELMDLSSYQLISMFLVIESHKKNSFWKPFIEVLALLSDFAYAPLIWLVENTNEIFFRKLPPPTQAHALAQLERFNLDYSVIINLLSTKYINIEVERLISKREFLRMWMCCNSRCLYMELPSFLNKSKEDNFTMVPYVDFLNHSSEDGCTVKINSFGFQVTSGLNYPENSQLYFKYGAHSNEFLLCEYGFMFERGMNSWNYIDINEQVIALMEPHHVEFLKDQGYYNDYTVSLSDVSFRVQVALAVIQETPEGLSSKRITNFINGLTQGTSFEAKSKQMLKEILSGIVEECQQVFNTNLQQFSNDEKYSRIITRLYEDRFDIAKTHLDLLEG